MTTTPATKVTPDDKLRNKVRAALKIEAQLGNIVEKLSTAVSAAWTVFLAGDEQSMTSWEKVWEEERAGYEGLKLAAPIRKAIVRELAIEGMSSRAIAVALGIGHATAARDSAGVSDETVGTDGKKQAKSSKARSKAKTETEVEPVDTTIAIPVDAATQLLDALQGWSLNSHTSHETAVKYGEALADAVKVALGIEVADKVAA
jgi:hypothetical protein